MSEFPQKDPGQCFRIPQQTLLRLTGGDRQKWLHNFCTADIKSLEPGQGCEAFVLNVKGKTMAHIIVLASKYDLIVLLVGQPETPLVEHFEKYIITEDVRIEDLSVNHELWYANGDRIDLMFQRSFPKWVAYGHGLVRDRVVAVSTSLRGKPDWLMLVERSENVPLWNGGMHEISQQQFDELRFVSRFPVTGSDVTTAHLPQEFCRDEQAISFTKGCYLGQETVARIDALGHVNYFFVQLEWGVESAEVGLELTRDDKAVGNVTSVAGVRGLGFVRRLMAKPGERFGSALGEVTVVANPI